MRIDAMYPYLIVANAAEAATFYARVFGAVERFRLTEPSGRIGHLELELGGGLLMLADPYPECDLRPPAPGQPVSASIHLHVQDTDAVVQRAVEHGARLERAPADQFYGERTASFFCPFGHRWLIGHEVEAMSPEEMQRRYDALFERA